MSDDLDLPDVAASLAGLHADPSVLLGRVISALEAAGVRTEVDWDLETFDVLGDGPEHEQVLGVVMQRSAAVVFHLVHGAYLTEQERDRVAPAVMRANGLLDVSAVELDVELGTLSLRTAVEIGDTDLDRATLGALLTTALTRVRHDWDLVSPGLLRVAAGQLDAVAATKEWR